MYQNQAQKDGDVVDVGNGHGAGDTNQGAPWLDLSKLCVFVEACNAVRNQGRPCISLRGTGQRYPALALQVVQAVGVQDIFRTHRPC